MALFLSGASGCGSSTSGTSYSNPTYVAVDPAEFLGDVPCSQSDNGGLRSYVATLRDVTLDFRLPSSPPTPCSQSVYFSGVVAQSGFGTSAHRYVAEIEAYDTASLQPKHEGSAIQLQEGATVAPRWVGACGTRRSSLEPLLDGADAGVAGAVEDAGFATHFAGPVQPVARRTVTFRGCWLREIQPGDDSARVTVDLSQALVGLRCGSAPGEVERFEVTLDDRVETAACGESVVFDDLEAGRLLTFDVTAHGAEQSGDAGQIDAGPPQTWTTRCYQEPTPGLQLAARCDPLVPGG